MGEAIGGAKDRQTAAESDIQGASKHAMYPAQLIIVSLAVSIDHQRKQLKAIFVCILTDRLIMQRKHATSIALYCDERLE